MYIITGVDGNFGSKVVEEILHNVAPDQLILTSPVPEKIKPAVIEHWQSLGLTVRKADYSDTNSLKAAFTGGDRLFLISAMTVGDVRQQQHKNAIDAAKSCGIQHITYTSFLGADSKEIRQVVAIDHRETELYLQKSGIQWNTLRDSLYLENYLFAFAAIALKEKKWRTSAGEGQAAFVARDDCARVAVALLTGKGEPNRGYEVTGSELISVHKICDMVAQRADVAIEYCSMDDEALYQYYDALGVPRKATGDFSHSPYAWCSEDLVTNEAAVREGVMTKISDTIKQLTGRDPLTAADLLEKAAATWPTR